MKISTEFKSAAKIVGEERAVELIAKAGFDAWDFSMDKMCNYDVDLGKVIESSHSLAGSNYLAFARRLKQIGLDNGIVCSQSHAPTPLYCDATRSYYKRAIECTREAGGEICVIHPNNFKSAEENAEMYLELLPFAKECGVKIATENMIAWSREKQRITVCACATKEDFLAHLDAVNDDFFVACVDIGHAEILGEDGVSAESMIRAIGSRIKTLHIHDNDKRHDNHQIPFSMNIDYVPVIKALKDVGYDGYITLEAYKYLEAFNQDNIFEGIKNLAASAKKFAGMF